MNIASGPGTLGVRQEYNLDGFIAGHQTHSFTPLVQPIHLLPCFWELTGSWRTQRKPTWTHGEHENAGTNAGAVRQQCYATQCIIFTIIYSVKPIIIFYHASSLSSGTIFAIVISVIKNLLFCIQCIYPLSLCSSCGHSS